MTRFLKLSVFVMMTWLLVSCAEIEARPVKEITVARKALEAQFEKTKKIEGNDHIVPEREAPGGPDPHHHFNFIVSNK
ncbi:hypothetical protein ABFS82_08G138500 [Erythranthe guttata]